MKPRLEQMIGALPALPGVYRFRNAEEYDLYIGRTANLRRRVASYWSSLRDRQEDSDIHGWSSGVLVSFGIRDGRLRLWSQRPCDLAAAQPLLALTPRPWLGFARHNAELAAAQSHRRG